MNVNFGLFPEFPKSARIRGKDRKQAMSARALQDLSRWLDGAQSQETAAE
jgi:methylenetetrahydrofolate--tRNA-(uracil-5-)-methyltransferase